MAKAMTEGNTTEVRHTAAGEKKDKERVIGKEEFDKSRIEAEQRVMSGEDVEGGFLFNNLKDAFANNPEASRFGAVANTYKDAKDGSTNLDDAAELQRTIVSLNTFYEHIGAGKYEVRIQTDEKTTPEQRRALIKQKVAEDVAKMPEQFAIHEMSDYLDHRARADYLQKSLRSSLPMGRVYDRSLEPATMQTRSLVRLDAYEMQRAADRVYWAGQRLVGEIGDDRVRREFHNVRSQRLSFSEESAVPLSARSEEERNSLISQRLTTLRQQIAETRGEKFAKHYDNLSAAEKVNLASAMIEDEEAVAAAGRNFDRAVSIESADQVTKYVSESKEARVRLKSRVAEMDVMLAGQRTKDSISKLRDIRRKIALGGGKQHGLKREEVNQALGVVNERVSSFIGENVADLKKDIAPIIDEAIQKAESVDDVLARGVVALGEKFEATVGRVVDAAKDNIVEARNDLGDLVNRIVPNAERRRLNQRKQAFEARHARTVARDRVASQLGIAVLEVKHLGALGLRRIIGGSTLTDEEKKQFSEKREKVVKAADRLNEMKTRQHDKERQNNPHFEYFWKNIDEYVNEVVNKPVESPPPSPPPTSTEVPSSEAPKSVALETELRSHFRPGLIDYEVLKYRGKSGEEHNVLIWTDGKSVISEEVDDDGTFKEAFNKYDLKEGESAKEVINKSLTDLTNIYDQKKEDYQYKRGLYFSQDTDGSMVIVEEGKSGKATLESPGKTATSGKEKGPEKKKAEPMTQEDLQKMYPDSQQHEIVKFRDEKGNEQHLLGWWDGEKFRSVNISRLGRRYGKNLSEVEAKTVEEAVRLFNEQIGKSVPKGQKYERGFSFIVDQGGKIQIAKPEKKKAKPKTEEDELKPDDETEKELYDRIKELRKSKSEAKVEHGNANSRESFDKYLDSVRNWGDGLTSYNSYLNTKLAVDRTDLEGNPDYLKYKSIDQEMTDLVRKLRDVQQKPGSEVSEEESVLEEYQKKMWEKYRVFAGLRKAGVFK